MKFKNHGQKALEIRTKVFGENHIKVIETINLLGMLNVNKLNYMEGEKLYLKCLELIDKMIGNRTLEQELLAAWIYTNLGFLYRQMCKYKASENFIIKSLEIREKWSGPNHLLYAEGLNNLGVTTNALGNYEKGAEICEKALNIRLKYLGPHHPQVQISQFNVNNCRLLKGEYNLSENPAMKMFRNVRFLGDEEILEKLNHSNNMKQNIMNDIVCSEQWLIHNGYRTIEGYYLPLQDLVKQYKNLKEKINKDEVTFIFDTVIKLYKIHNKFLEKLKKEGEKLTIQKLCKLFLKHIVADGFSVYLKHTQKYLLIMKKMVELKLENAIKELIENKAISLNYKYGIEKCLVTFNFRYPRYMLFFTSLQEYSKNDEDSKIVQDVVIKLKNLGQQILKTR